MGKRLVGLIGLVAGVAMFAGVAQARTYQDHLKLQYDTDSQQRVRTSEVPTGETVTDTSITDQHESQLSSTAVPADKLHKYTQVMWTYTGTTSGVRVTLYAGGRTFYKSNADPTSGETTTLSGLEVWVDETEKIEVYIDGGTTADDISLTLFGAEYSQP